MNVVAEAGMGRIGYETVDVGGSDAALENPDLAAVERVVRQHHKLACR